MFRPKLIWGIHAAASESHFQQTTLNLLLLPVVGVGSAPSSTATRFPACCRVRAASAAAAAGARLTSCGRVAAPVVYAAPSLLVGARVLGSVSATVKLRIETSPLLELVCSTSTSTGPTSVASPVRSLGVLCPASPRSKRRERTAAPLYCPAAVAARVPRGRTTTPPVCGWCVGGGASGSCWPPPP